MLKHLDNLIRDLLMAEVPGLRAGPGTPKPEQIGIRPPDDDWRAFVAGLVTLKALNIYLVELREHRRLRTSERSLRVEGGTAFETPAWARLDCHYLITAWSPGQQNQQVEPTLAEHELLYQAAAAFFRRPSLVPRDVYAPGPLPSGFPGGLADVELPTTVLPVEGFPKYAEFWGTMGQVHPWKPAVYLVVTIPVTLPEAEVGGVVTTLSVGLRQGAGPGGEESLAAIGGRVLDSQNPLPGGSPAPVADAWVRLESPPGTAVATATSDAQGRFAFDRLRPGPYRLRCRDGARPEPTPRDVVVPGQASDYELIFA